MKINFRKIIDWGAACMRKAWTLCFPMFLVLMALIDVIGLADIHYPRNKSVYCLLGLGIVFYISCAWCILFPLNKWNVSTFLISLVAIIGMFYFNDDIVHISAHSACIESSAPCPEGVVLEGG